MGQDPQNVTPTNDLTPRETFVQRPPGCPGACLRLFSSIHHRCYACNEHIWTWNSSHSCWLSPEVSRPTLPPRCDEARLHCRQGTVSRRQAGSTRPTPARSGWGRDCWQASRRWIGCGFCRGTASSSQRCGSSHHLAWRCGQFSWVVSALSLLRGNFLLADSHIVFLIENRIHFAFIVRGDRCNSRSARCFPFEKREALRKGNVLGK